MDKGPSDAAGIVTITQVRPIDASVFGARQLASTSAFKVVPVCR